MKTHLKKMLGLAALGIALVSTTVPTWAGFVMSHRVTLSGNTNSQTAFGSMPAARYSVGNTVESIGCTVYAYNDPPLVVCQARDALNAALVCSSRDPRIFAAVQAMNDNSAISFSKWRTQGGCLSLYITLESVDFP